MEEENQVRTDVKISISPCESKEDRTVERGKYGTNICKIR